ncbi:MAG: IMPACT family protein [Clostridiales bacterium]|nr:IMPACT family protein [Clostridiales bacterium]
MEKYKTILSPASDEFVERRSRFIGNIKPVSSSEEAIAFINDIKSKYWDATHNVYAYVLREGQTRRYSDDGEPQGTAGMPVLNVLLKEELTDCVVTVTRYFGGVLLGAGGLVRAYSHGAKIAVDAGKIITVSLCDILKIVSDYNFYGRLVPLVSEYGGKIEDTDFADGVTLTVKMPSDVSRAFDDKMFDLSNGRFKSEKIGEIFASVD